MSIRKRLGRAVLSVAALSVSLLASVATDPAHAHETVVRFYEHVNRGGGVLETHESPSSISDLRSHQVCWWWGCPNFNDRISSVETTGSAVLLYEHINFGGAVACVPPHTFVNMPADWNERASSVKVLLGERETDGCPWGYRQLLPVTKSTTTTTTTLAQEP